MSYLIFPCLALPCLTCHELTLPYLSLPYRIFPHITLPDLTLHCIVLVYQYVVCVCRMQHDMLQDSISQTNTNGLQTRRITMLLNGMTTLMSDTTP